MPEEKISIEVRGLTIGYGKRIIQKNLNFRIRQGAIVCILGGSGCGKSTLLKHMIGLYPPMSGDIFLLGNSIVHAEGAAKRAVMRKFGVAYQNGALFRSFTLFENIALPLREFTSLTENEIGEKVRSILSLVHLSGFEDYMPSDLSGGMVKRAAFARAMALDPEILFFDEPSAGLDPISSADLDSLILSIRKRTGATIVMVTHELPSIFTVADRAIILGSEAGGIVDDGIPEDLRLHSKSEFVRNFLNRNARADAPAEARSH